MNKLISGLIGRCDKTLALASLAALLDGAPSRLLRMQKGLVGSKETDSTVWEDGESPRYQERAVPDPFPSVTQRIKWPTDGWGLVYETTSDHR